eukprot:EST44698.1 Elongation factor Tu GTP binding and transmembrane domain-containing protein [Spironucleus salmonicida]
MPNRRFTILILGNQNAGKSSFINNCIGQKLLKTGHGATTNHISIIIPGASRQTLSLNQAQNLVPFTNLPPQSTVEIFDGYKKNDQDLQNSQFLSQVSAIFEVENQPKSISPFIFIDTPGFVEKTDFQPLKQLIKQVDLILLFVESSKFQLTNQTIELINHIVNKNIDMKIILSKIDLVGSKFEYVQNVVSCSQMIQRCIQFKEFDIYPITLPKFSSAKSKVQSELNGSGMSLEKLEAPFIVSNFDCLKDFEDEMENQIIIQFRNLLDRFKIDCKNLNRSIKDYEQTCKQIKKFTIKMWSLRVFLICSLIGIVMIKFNKNTQIFSNLVIINIISLIASLFIWKKPLVGMQKIGEMESLVDGNLMQCVKKLEAVQIE